MPKTFCFFLKLKEILGTKKCSLRENSFQRRFFFLFFNAAGREYGRWRDFSKDREYRNVQELSWVRHRLFCRHYNSRVLFELCWRTRLGALWDQDGNWNLVRWREGSCAMGRPCREAPRVSCPRRNQWDNAELLGERSRERWWIVVARLWLDRLGAWCPCNFHPRGSDSEACPDRATRTPGNFETGLTAYFIYGKREERSKWNKYH